MKRKFTATIFFLNLTLVGLLTFQNGSQSGTKGVIESSEEGCQELRTDIVGPDILKESAESQGLAMDFYPVPADLLAWSTCGPGVLFIFQESEILSQTGYAGQSSRSPPF